MESRGEALVQSLNQPATIGRYLPEGPGLPAGCALGCKPFLITCLRTRVLGSMWGMSVTSLWHAFQLARERSVAPVGELVIAPSTRLILSAPQPLLLLMEQTNNRGAFICL